MPEELLVIVAMAVAPAESFIIDVDEGELTWMSDVESDVSLPSTLGGAGAIFFGFSFGLDELALK
jgi:hypothetical protein